MDRERGQRADGREAKGADRGAVQRKKAGRAGDGRLRLLVQAAWFALTNGYAAGFLEKKIYTGKLKALCVPGLNCYSCPGALLSCPIGSLQAVLSSSEFTVSCYVLGFLMMFGTVLGRFVCGWLCPFGLVQDLLHRIPFPGKRKNLPGHRVLKNMKYVILVLFVILLPSLAVGITGNGDPWFCKYICPSGTLMGGIPLALGNPLLRSAIGALFSWKMFLLILVAVLSVKYYRPFCKYVCPLGAVYGLFNPVALYRLKVDGDKCIRCGACQRACGMDIKVWETPNSAECIRCGDCKNACPTGAICTSADSLRRAAAEKRLKKTAERAAGKKA